MRVVYDLLEARYILQRLPETSNTRQDIQSKVEQIRARVEKAKALYKEPGASEEEASRIASYVFDAKKIKVPDLIPDLVKKPEKLNRGLSNDIKKDRDFALGGPR